jgi:hypothetical protein
MRHFLKIDATGKPAAANTTDHVAVIDARTQLMWSAADVRDRATFADAGAACAALTLAGYSDWRLPTVEELFALADRSKRGPAIDTDAFPTCEGGWYWSATVDASAPSDLAWGVYFGNGYCGCYDQDSQGRVRAVRSVVPSASGQ